MAQEFSKPASTTIPLGIELLSFPKPSGASFGNLMTAFPEYMVDAFQRSVLFFDLLRRPGDGRASVAGTTAPRPAASH